ncbi:helix-turn-helix domain-containing protein [Oceanicoccus sagamiensis]|uniref:Transcriptional regulator n=1 Tax=Oceanicoccus sagamiensis TaxID=716816 RepID=A0A1X9NEF5_9GAMM|nr:helix-turn-helix transcriptional regulator [Oceanicoccus sagamiensis]ARN74812.1 transcriptional regulator [Oceanicoccus sagamiensis]
MNTIGPRVRHLRRAQGLTQEDLAGQCNLLGWDLSRSTLAKIESQVRKVSDSEAALLSQALHLPVEELYKTKES